jgi:predicted ABC-type ATPase
MTRPNTLPRELGENPKTIEFELIEEEPGFTLDEAYAFLTGADPSTSSLPKITVAAAEVHTGAMVALIPTAAEAKRLALPEGEPISQLHTTLMYLGEAADIPDEAREAMITRIRNLVSDGLKPHYELPLVAEGFSISVFNPPGHTKDDGKQRDTCLVLGLSGNELNEIHTLVSNAISSTAQDVGVTLPEQHKPWIPHITLVYVDPRKNKSLIGEAYKRTGPVTFDRIRLAFGGENFDVPLKPLTASIQVETHITGPNHGPEDQWKHGRRFPTGANGKPDKSQPPKETPKQLQQQAKATQKKIDTARARAEFLAELEEIAVINQANGEELSRMAGVAADRFGVREDPEVAKLLARAESGDAAMVEATLEALAEKLGLSRVGGELGSKQIVKFDEKQHDMLPGEKPTPFVEIVRPGYKAEIDGKERQLVRAIVAATDTKTTSSQTFTDRIKRVEKALSGVFQTLSTHRVYRDKDGVWDKDRDKLHRQIVEDMYAKAQNVPTDGRGIFTGGPTGAGKSSALKKLGVKPGEYFTVDPDAVKEEMARRGMVPDIPGYPDLAPMERATLVHRESMRVANMLMDRAVADQRNVIWDTTMINADSIERWVDQMRQDGYDNIRGVFVQALPEVARARVQRRYEEGMNAFLQSKGKGIGGRYIPAAVQNEKGQNAAFHAFRELRSLFDDWKHYDNSIEGKDPKLINEKS